MARKVDLPRVWEVAVPHPDIFSGDLDPARFAISLNAVDLGQGAKDYVEPDRFFQKTFEHSVGEEEIKEGMLSQLEAEERKEVEGRIRERQEELQQTIRRAYTRLFRPRPPEGVEEIHTRRRELVRAETIAEYAWEVLKGEGRLVEKLSDSAEEVTTAVAEGLSLVTAVRDRASPSPPRSRGDRVPYNPGRCRGLKLSGGMASIPRPKPGHGPGGLSSPYGSWATGQP